MSVDRDSIGLIIPDDRVVEAALYAADSTYTQAGPRPGIPTPTVDTAAALEASGTMTASEYLEIQTAQSGFAVPSIRAATYLHRRAASGAFQGDDGPQTFRGWAWVVRRANGGAQSNSRPHAITLQVGDNAGRVVCAAHRDAGAADRVDVFTLDPGGAWSAAIIADSGSAMATATHPCLVELPSGRILLYAWGIAGTNGQVIRVSASDDAGATWRLISATGSPTLDTSAYTPGQLRAAYAGGVVLLFATVVDLGASQYVAWQLASDADGYTLEAITIGDGSVAAERGRAWTPYVSDNGAFFVMYYRVASSAHYVQTLISPWQAYTSAEEASAGIAAGSATFETDELSVYRDNRGYFRAFVRLTTTFELFPVYSRDGVAWYSPTGRLVGTQANVALGFGNADVYLDRSTATDQRGTTVIVGEPVIAVEAFDDDSLLCAYYGGNSSLTMPTVGGLDVRQRGFEMAGVHDTVQTGMIAVEDIQGQGWTRTTAGAPTETYDATGVVITTAGGTDQRYYSITGQASVALVAVDQIDVTVVSGGTAAAEDIAFVRRIADGVADYEVSIRLQSTQFRVRDVNGAADLVTVVISLTSGIQIRVYLNAGLLSVYYRSLSGQDPLTNPATQVWSLAYSGAITNDGATPNAAGLTRFGHVTSGGTGQSRWRWTAGITLEDVASSSSATGRLEIEDGPAAYGEYATNNPPGSESAVLGRRYNPFAPGVVTGTAIRLVDGPTAGGDTWTISARYDYPIGRIHTPSPRQRWRSTGDIANDIVWELNSAANTILSSSRAIGVLLAGINFPTAILAGYNGTTWTDLLTLDAAAGLTGLKYVRTGDTVTVDVSTAGAAAVAWLQRGELAGGTWYDQSTTKVRTIRVQTSGRWDMSRAQLHPVLYLDGVDATEPTSGTCDLWRPMVAAVARDVGNYRRLRLTANPDAIDTVTGYNEMGVSLIGPYLPLAPYSWGRSIEDQPAVDLVELESGLRVSRVRAPPMRRIAVSWSDGEPTRRIYDPEVPPLFAGARGVRADTPGLVAGLLRELNGSRTPVALIAALGADGQQSRADAVIYGRITSTAMREVVVGEELEDEVQRIAEIVVEEER